MGLSKAERPDAPIMALEPLGNRVRCEADTNPVIKPDSDPQAMLPAVLVDGWRVVGDPLQWILQRHQGGAWHNRSYCCTRSALLRCISEYVGADADVSAVLRLPAWHPDRTRIERASASKSPDPIAVTLEPVPGPEQVEREDRP